MSKTTKKALVYDNSCPMCNWYSGKFVDAGMLEDKNRVAFCEINNEMAQRIDLNKAKNEIPLVDLNGGKTLYGVDSLIAILSPRKPWVAISMKFPPAYWLAKQAYRMVSYNRRLISPLPKTVTTDPVQPDFRLKYRLIYVLFGALVATLISFWFGNVFDDQIGLKNAGTEFVVMVGFGWIVQMLLSLVLLPPVKAFNYIGNLVTILILGVLVLIPGCVFGSLLESSGWWIPTASVSISFSIMLWQHIKRTSRLKITQVWTLLWIILLAISSTFFYYELILSL
jgi:predicted DCC family thiol-disulfide oxidoreductase YuxK